MSFSNQTSLHTHLLGVVVRPARLADWGRMERKCDPRPLRRGRRFRPFADPVRLAVSPDGSHPSSAARRGRLAPPPRTLPAPWSESAVSRAVQCDFTVRDFDGFRFSGSGDSRENKPRGARPVNTLGGRGMPRQPRTCVAGSTPRHGGVAVRHYGRSAETGTTWTPSGRV